MTHSIIPPSSAEIWGAPDGCTGWVLMTQQYPQLPNGPYQTEADEGEASHEIAATLINAAAVGVTLTADNFIDKPAANGLLFTAEMFDGAKIYTDDVINVMRTTAVFGGPNFGNEFKIAAPSIHELSFGTTDQFIYDRNHGDLFIWDYKFGHDTVEAFENWQTINYLAGIIEALQIDGFVAQHTTVYVRIVQPRAFHAKGVVREWKLKAADLRPYFNILNHNAHKALSNAAEIHSGPHCKNCSARHVCPAALKAGMQLYEITRQPVPEPLSFEALGIQLAIIKRALKQLEYLESGFEEQVKNLIRSGKNIPGWMVEQSSGRETWSKPISEVIMLGELLGHNLKKPDDAITPNQARKLGIDKDVIKLYSATPKTGFKVVPDNLNKAKQVFKS